MSNAARLAIPGTGDNGKVPVYDEGNDEWDLAVAPTHEAYTDHGNTGTTETVNLADGNVHRVVLDANCTFTFSGATSGRAASFTLIVVQDGTGSRTVTWPASAVWAGGDEPTLSSAANAVDILSFMSVDGGTTWFGFVAGQAFS